MPGLEPGTSRLSMLSECAYHLRYIRVDPSAQTHSISWPRPSGRPPLTRLLVQKIFILIFLGFMCHRGSINPTPCPEGTYQNQMRQGSCKRCPVEHECPRTKMEFPERCPDGTHGHESGLIHCRACPMGHFCISGRKEKCPPGSFSDTEEAIECSYCSRGSYQDEDGQKSCKQCEGIVIFFSFLFSRLYLNIIIIRLQKKPNFFGFHTRTH